MVTRAGHAVGGLPTPTWSPEDVRRAVHDVLSRPQFRQPLQSPLAQGREWLLDRLGRLLDAALAGTHGSLVGWAVLAVLVVVVVLLAVWAVRGVVSEPGAASTRATVRRRSARDWRGEADGHARRGAWREAMRCRHRALVAELVGRGLIDEVPGRTAGEYRAEVARNVPAAAADFAVATDLFELAWYGNTPTGPEEDARFRRLAGAVLRRAGAGSRAEAAVGAGA